MLADATDISTLADAYEVPADQPRLTTVVVPVVVRIRRP